MKSYSTHRERLAGPIQINRVIVKAPTHVVTRLWGRNPIKPLVEIRGPGDWTPNWETGPILIPEREFCGFLLDPPDAPARIQTLYSPLSD
jgi:hypothetical protein